MSETKVDHWLANPTTNEFPYDAVLGEYLRVGKHFVDDSLLKSLASVRETIDAVPELAGPQTDLLRRFLTTALDKWDGRYDYPTYIALDVLALPTIEDELELAAQVLRRRDQLVLALMVDALGFESAVADGSTTILPELRPDARTRAKRYRLGMHVAASAAARLGIDVNANASDPAQAARLLSATVEGGRLDLDCRVLRLSMLPVYICHDEYLFIRVLQLFETTFAMLAVQLCAGMTAMVNGDWSAGASSLRLAQLVLRESAPLFSLLATMQVAAFQRFREFTEGASAIQSRNYKILESVCRRPDQDRLDSLAYLSVPEVRARVLAGQLTLDEVYGSTLATSRIPAAEHEELVAAMQDFASAVLRWRQTHYRLAVRMLGERSGTGYTEGTPYLRAVRDIPVFRSVRTAEGELSA